VCIQPPFLSLCGVCPPPFRVGGKTPPWVRCVEHPRAIRPMLPQPRGLKFFSRPPGTNLFSNPLYCKPHKRGIRNSPGNPGNKPLSWPLKPFQKKFPTHNLLIPKNKIPKPREARTPPVFNSGSPAGPLPGFPAPGTTPPFPSPLVLLGRRGPSPGFLNKKKKGGLKSQRKVLETPPLGRAPFFPGPQAKLGPKFFSRVFPSRFREFFCSVPFWKLGQPTKGNLAG